VCREQQLAQKSKVGPHVVLAQAHVGGSVVAANTVMEAKAVVQQEVPLGRLPSSHLVWPALTLASHSPLVPALEPIGLLQFAALAPV